MDKHTDPILDYSSATEKENVHRVRELYGRIATGQGLDEFFAPGFVQHNPLFGTGAAGFRTTAGGFRERFPDLTLELEIAIAQNDRVLSFVTWRGHEAGSGKELEVEFADLYRFQDGRAAEHWDCVGYAELEPFGIAKPAHQQPDTPADRTGTPAQLDNLARLEGYVRDVTIQDTSEAYRYMSEGFVQHDPMIAPGLDGFRQCCENFHQMCPDMKVYPHHMVVGAEHVGAIWSWNGHKAGSTDDLSLPTADIYSVGDGKFTEHWDVIDFSHIVALLGFHPKAVFEQQKQGS